MAEKIGKAMLVLGVALSAWILVTVEGVLYAAWALERESPCQLGTSESCAFGWLAAFGFGGLFGLEALVGMLIAGTLAATGNWLGARFVAYSLVGLLALEHVWLFV
jgi:hypothetical protein